MTAAKLTCACNMLRTSNSFSRGDTGVVIDSEPHLSRTCKPSFGFATLAVCVHTGRFVFLFYTPTKPLIQLHIKYKTVLFPKLYFVYIFDIYNNEAPSGFTLTLQDTRSIHDSMNRQQIEVIS